MLRKIANIVFLVWIFGAEIFSNRAFGQDAQFTQFYAAPTYLNPAFAGATPCWRIGLNYRNQWFLGPVAYPSYMVWADKNFRKIRSGAGLYVLYDQIGSGGYQTYEFAGQFAHQINLTDEIFFRLGIQPSYHLKYYTLGTNYSYGDEYTNLEGRVRGTSDASNIAGSMEFFDLSTGSLLYSESFWLGVSIHHLLRPFLAEPRRDRTPMRVSLHGGLKIELHDAYSSLLKPALQIRNQGGNWQADLGLYYERNKLILGAWYRGIPITSTSAAINHDALAFLAGLRIHTLCVAYSYDLPLNKLISTFGSHELSAVFEFCVYNKRKPPRNVQQLPCPIF